MSLIVEIIGALTMLFGFALLLGAVIGALAVLISSRVRSLLFEHLGGVPGFRSQSTIRATGAIFCYLLLISFVAIGVGATMLPPTDDNETVTAANTVPPTPEAAHTESTTRTLSPEITSTETPTSTPTSTLTATPTPTSTPTPTATPTPTPTTTVSPFGDDYYLTAIRGTLESEGYDIQSAEVADGRSNGGDKTIILSYHSSATTTSELASEIGGFTGAFVGTVKDNWDIDAMIVVVGDQQGQAVGTFYCEEEWAQSYIDGEITSEQLATKVAGTIETY